MALINVGTFASVLANYVRQKLAEVHRAAILVRCTADGDMIAAAFGNDNYASSSTARREVALLRRQLNDVSLQELAFGLSHDGQSWSLLVKADCQGFQTAAGKAFRSEMLRAALDEAVWTAWRAVSGPDAEVGASRLPEGSRLADALKLL
jgi:hypothetical protein